MQIAMSNEKIDLCSKTKKHLYKGPCYHADTVGLWPLAEKDPAITDLMQQIAKASLR